MKGNLADMSVADLIQHYCRDQKSACLIVEKSPGSKAELWFDSGGVVHARWGNLAGEEAVYQVLGWEKGVFSLDAEAVAPERTITRNHLSLLLEGARRLDESRQVEIPELSDEPVAAAPEQTAEADAVKPAKLRGIDPSLLGVLAEAVISYEAHSALMFMIPGWTVMNVAERLQNIFISLAVLGYGRVKAERMDGASTQVTLQTKFIAGSQSNSEADDTPYCQGLSDYLQSAFAIAADKERRKVHVVETQCRAVGFERCVFDVQIG